jgi:tetratricopeptide (TPR) repeat protein
MSPELPPDEARDRFLRAESAAAETAAVVRAALLAGGDPQPWRPAATAAASYAAALDRARAAAATLVGDTAGEEARAAGLADELAALPPAERRTAVERDRRFHTWAAAAALRQASFDACTEDAARAVELAGLAVAALDAAPASPGPGERTAADLRALTVGQLANAQRVATDLRAAERSFGRAFEALAQGTGDPAVRSRLQSLAASLRSDQGRFADAVSLARRAARGYLRLGDHHGYGRTLLKQASFHTHRDELEEACAVLAEALDHIDAAAEPRLAFAARHNRAFYLESLGHLEQAESELAAAEPLCRAPLDRVRFTWLRGRLAIKAAMRRGTDPAAGEADLWRAREDFLGHGIGYAAALVSLDLAVLYAEQGRGADMRRLAEEMMPIFASRDVHDEARAALRLWADAARTEAAGVSLVRDVAAYLERARHQPGLRFER